jgi:hypothetical protein
MKTVTVSLDKIDGRISELKRELQDIGLEIERLEHFKAMALELGGSVQELRPSNPKNKTRKQEIVDYLLAFKMASRKEISEGTGIPVGTIAYVMRDSDTFVNAARGKWHLTESALSDAGVPTLSEPPDLFDPAESPT